MDEFYCKYCGKSFKSKKSVAAHVSSCKEYYLQRDGNLDKYYEKFNKIKRYYENERNLKEQKTEIELNNWISEQHRCETCGKIMTDLYGSGRFCCESCANSHKLSIYTKEKISKSLKNTKSIQVKNKNPRYCVICKNIIPYKYRKRKTCSEQCKQLLSYNSRIENCRKAGIKSATSQNKRSKNEINFCKLCEEYFGKENVLHNEPIFNGWDADVILLNYKLAILWNGPWHYRKITKNHKLKQVQNRDKIKLHEISQCGYTPYIIKDTGKYNYDKVQQEFEILLKYLNL